MPDTRRAGEPIDALPISWLPMRRLPPWIFAVVAIALMGVDFLTGPYFQFPSVYILFVVLGAWFNGLGTGLMMALVLPFTRVALMEFYWDAPWDPPIFVATALTRAAAWSLLAWMTARLAHHERNLRAEVETLISLLPVCADCHQIRATDDTWQRLDVYAAQHTSHFSRGLCPTCLRARLPEHVAPE